MFIFWHNPLYFYIWQLLDFVFDKLLENSFMRQLYRYNARCNWVVNIIITNSIINGNKMGEFMSENTLLTPLLELVWPSTSSCLWSQKLSVVTTDHYYERDDYNFTQALNVYVYWFSKTKEVYVYCLNSSYYSGAAYKFYMRVCFLLWSIYPGGFAASFKRFNFWICSIRSCRVLIGKNC